MISAIDDIISIRGFLNTSYINMQVLQAGCVGNKQFWKLKKKSIETLQNEPSSQIFPARYDKHFIKKKNHGDVHKQTCGL